jgi:hypothetical protein
MEENFNNQQTLSLPYILLPSISEPGDMELLVSAPDGTLLDFDLSKETAEKFNDVLNNPGLWRSFFESLIASLDRVEQNAQ